VRASLLSLILLLPALWAGSVAAEGSVQYMVEMEVWIDGEEQGTPIVVVEPGKPAFVEVGRSAGPQAWRVEVLVQPAASADADLGDNIWLEMAVYDRSEGELSLLADSLLGVPEGQPGVLSVVESDRQEASAPAPAESLVHVTARVSRLRPAEQRD
jgi:hypothetical protein